MSIVNLYCKIYVDADITLEELINGIALLLSGVVNGQSIFTKIGVLDARKNEEFNEQSRRKFPDGFVYFRYYIDIDSVNGNEKEYINMIGSMLVYLWSQGWPAVAACDYEDKLPNNGGYKSSLLPWPKI